jgi:hypothetical protein
MNNAEQFLEALTQQLTQAIWLQVGMQAVQAGLVGSVSQHGGHSSFSC